MCYCPGCYNFFSDKDIIATDKIVSFVAKYNNRFNNCKVTLSGGEPLLRIDIAELISKLKSLNCCLNIDTMGLPLIEIYDNELLNALKNVEYIGIPIDGITNRTIQYFRHNITVEMCDKVLREVKKINKLCINTVVHSLNTNEITEIASIVDKETNIYKWQLFQYMPIGPRGYAMRDIYRIEDDTFEKIKNKLLSLRLRASLQLDFKSVSDRMNKYILLGSDGDIWLPRMNEKRTILGHIDEDDIIEKIANIKCYEEI